MDIALDSNVFVSDPWLRSQKARMLIDFVHKVQGRLILPEAVEIEVRAAVARRFSEAANEIAESVQAGSDLGLRGLVEFDVDVVLQETKQAWEKEFERRLRGANVKRVTLDAEAAKEAVARTANRMPPAERKGQHRDALIWSSLLNYIASRTYSSALAFISYNTRDFAGQDNATLHPGLTQEAESAGILYYPTLDDFLADHAERFEFLTVEWVAERLDLDLVEDIVKDELYRTTRPKYRLFGFGDETHRYYEPRELAHVHRVDIDLDDVFIWEFDDEHVEVNVSCTAHVEADVESERVQAPWNPHTAMENDLMELEYPRYKVFRGYSDVGVTVGANVIEDDLADVWIEEIYEV